MLAWGATAVRDLVGLLFGLAAGFLGSLLAGLTLTLTAASLEQRQATTTPIRRIRTVLVTGANGYHASHVVRLLLEKGYVVHACVRDANNISSVEHLLRISSSSSSRSTTAGGRLKLKLKLKLKPKLKLFSTGDVGDKSLYGRYDAPLRGCDAVIHAATSPVVSKRGAGRGGLWFEFDPIRDLITPGIDATNELLGSILKCKKNTIRCLVVTSSVSAAAMAMSHYTEPKVKVVDESHWSDDAEQLARGDYHGCLKTRQERLCREWVATWIDRGALSKDFRMCAICPAQLITGPPADIDTGEGVITGNQHRFRPERWELLRWLTGGMRCSAPPSDDSVSVVHVRDCAAAHVAAMEKHSEDASEGVRQRYMCVGGSMHWNDVLKTLKVLYPAMPLDEKYMVYEGDDDDVATATTTTTAPTRFDTSRMESLLGKKPTGIEDIFAEMVEFFQSAGALE